MTLHDKQKNRTHLCLFDTHEVASSYSDPDKALQARNQVVLGDIVLIGTLPDTGIQKLPSCVLINGR